MSPPGSRKSIVIFNSLLGCLLCIISIAALPAAMPPSVGTDDIPPDPLALFGAMMPVFTSPRCARCHGLTDPYIPRNHPQKIDPETNCDSCHTAPSPNGGPSGWHLVSSTSLAHWAGKDTLEMCHLMVSAGTHDLRTHLETDSLIGLAFIGKRGDAVDVASPPPMTRAEFLKAFDLWGTEGDFACTGWAGTIKAVETVRYSDMATVAAGVTKQFSETFDRIAGFTIGERGEGARAAITVNGGIQVTDHVDSGGCQATSSWSDVFSHSLPTDSASVRVRLRPDGTYTIRVTGPPEQTVQTQGNSASSTCTPLTTEPPTTINATWDPWTFTIEGRLSSPANRNVIKGSEPPRTLTSATENAADPKIWLLNTIGVPGSASGGDIPFEYSKEWDLHRVQ